MSAVQECFRFAPIPELLGAGASSQLEGRMVRTIGVLQSHDPLSNTIVLRDKKTSLELIIGSELIEPFCFKKGELFQFSGEVYASEQRGKVLLKAMLSRCVTGLDLNVYLQAHSVRQRDISDEDSVSSSSEDEPSDPGI